VAVLCNLFFGALALKRETVNYMKSRNSSQSPQKTTPRVSLGPIADLEAHLPEDWWAKLFNALYIKTDGDVVENAENTAREIDAVIRLTGMRTDADILDLCCGQGRHSLELARRGFSKVRGIDRSRYLVRLARKRAENEGLDVQFREGDARNLRIPDDSIDCAMIMGNSFGYFANEADDLKVLEAIARCLRSSGTLLLDITDGDWVREHFDARSWEWIDDNQFVCRERSLLTDGQRLISREVIVNDEKGVLADQLYAERLYSLDGIKRILTDAGYRHIRFHGSVESLSDRGQDLGMMARRMLLTAAAPRKVWTATAKRAAPLSVAVLLGDPSLPDTVKLNGQFNDEDFATIDKLKDALAGLPGFCFRYLDNHATMQRDLGEERTDLVFNLCDEGFNNDAFMELHVPAMLEMQSIPYTGAGPSCLAACYDKALVRTVADSLGIPVPAETYIRSGDHSATLPSVFAAILKPNFGDSSIGITASSVVENERELMEALESLQMQFTDRPILVQEYLTGAEYSVCLIGNPGRNIQALPLLEVDFSRLDPELPRILGYESKWEPDSPYWSEISYREASLPDHEQAMLVDGAIRLFERLSRRDYARFDFRRGADGVLRLLEVNPNPGWCWDGKMNLMAAFGGQRYDELLERILIVASERYGFAPMRRDRGAAAIPA